MRGRRRPIRTRQPHCRRLDYGSAACSVYGLDGSTEGTGVDGGWWVGTRGTGLGAREGRITGVPPATGCHPGRGPGLKRTGAGSAETRDPGATTAHRSRAAGYQFKRRPLKATPEGDTGSPPEPVPSLTRCGDDNQGKAKPSAHDLGGDRLTARTDYVKRLVTTSRHLASSVNVTKPQLTVNGRADSHNDTAKKQKEHQPHNHVMNFGRNRGARLLKNAEHR